MRGRRSKALGEMTFRLRLAGSQDKAAQRDVVRALKTFLD
jgi:hypothetical protein